VLSSYLDGSLIETLKKRAEKELAESLTELKPEEAAVLVFLRARLEGESRA
jgi:DNA topoisomerase-1